MGEGRGEVQEKQDAEEDLHGLDRGAGAGGGSGRGGSQSASTSQTVHQATRR